MGRGNNSNHLMGTWSYDDFENKMKAVFGYSDYQRNASNCLKSLAGNWEHG